MIPSALRHRHPASPPPPAPARPRTPHVLSRQNPWCCLAAVFEHAGLRSVCGSLLGLRLGDSSCFCCALHGRLIPRSMCPQFCYCKIKIASNSAARVGCWMRVQGEVCDTERMGFHLRHHPWGHTIERLVRTTRARAPTAAPKAYAHVPQSRHRLAIAQQRKRGRAIERASGTFTPGCRGRRSVRRGSAACCRTALCHQACWSPKCSRGSVRLGLQLKQA